MMRCFYDFHIHSCLSPCADNDMTPNNIVNMAKLKSLNVIAITDHNSARNARAVMECGKKAGLLVLPGMEVETAEEVHVLTLFAQPEQCERMEKLVLAAMPPLENKVEIFGEQLVCNQLDKIVDREKQMLVTASSLAIQQVADLTNQMGGVCIPAHVDRSSYSVISNLGFIPGELRFSAVEVSKKLPLQEVVSLYPDLEKYRILISSDAHYLWDISEAEAYLEMEELSAEAMIEALRVPANS